MKKAIVIFALFLSGKIYSVPTTHTITYNVTTSVTCSIGDTLKLYGTFAGDYVAAMMSGTTTVSNIFPTIVTSAPFYVGYVIVLGSETSFFFAEISNGPTTGTINVLSPTGISNYYNKAVTYLFPNPFKDKIMLTVGKTTVLELLSSGGIPIMSIPVPKGETVVDLTNYPSGLYFLRHDDEIYKILKE